MCNLEIFIGVCHNRIKIYNNLCNCKLTGLVYANTHENAQNSVICRYGVMMFSKQLFLLILLSFLPSLPIFP